MRGSFTNNLLKNILLVLITFLVIIILYATHFMVGILVPIFLAFFTALLLDPFIQKLHLTKIPKWLSTLIVYLIFILLLLILLSVIVMSINNLIDDLPAITSNVKEQLNKITEIIYNFKFIKKLFSNKHKDFLNFIQKYTEQLLTVDYMQYYLIKPVQLSLDILKGFLFYAVSLIFIIPGIGQITSLTEKAFPGKNGKKINNIINKIKKQIQNYLIAKTIISFFVGFFTFIICTVFDIQYAPLWGIITFILNYVPYIGATITVTFPMLISILQGQPMSQLLSLVSSLISVHIIIGVIIEPKFMSKGVNLRPLVIFTSILIWGYIWGIAGIILSVPIMSAFNLVCENINTLKPISVLISAKEKEIIT